MDRFKAHPEAFYPGADIDLGDLFNSEVEVAFWAAAFAELAAQIERSEVGIRIGMSGG